MELKLKDESQEKKIEQKPIPVSSEFDSGSYTDNPVIISTVVEKPVQSNKKSGFDIVGSLKWIIVVLLICFGVKLVIDIASPKSEDLTSCVDLDAKELEDKLDITLQLDSDMASRIPQYSGGNVTVEGNEGIGIVYIDGKQIGLHIEDDKYSMFGVSIGDGEIQANNNTSYEYLDQFTVINDMASGQSTATFFYNTTSNDCFVIIVNDKSARIVAMTYFNDYKAISKNLTSLTE